MGWFLGVYMALRAAGEIFKIKDGEFLARFEELGDRASEKETARAAHIIQKRFIAHGHDCRPGEHLFLAVVLGAATSSIVGLILSGWISVLGSIIWGVIAFVTGIGFLIQMHDWYSELRLRDWAKTVGLWDLALDFQRRADEWNEEEKAREKAAKEARRKEYPEFYGFLHKVKVVVVSAFLIWLAVMIYLSIADAYHLWPMAP